jgi:hypothetical protein
MRYRLILTHRLGCCRRHSSYLCLFFSVGGCADPVTHWVGLN